MQCECVAVVFCQGGVGGRARWSLSHICMSVMLASSAKLIQERTQNANILSRSTVIEFAMVQALTNLLLCYVELSDLQTFCYALLRLQPATGCLGASDLQTLLL